MWNCSSGGLKVHPYDILLGMKVFYRPLFDKFYPCIVDGKPWRLEGKGEWVVRLRGLPRSYSVDLGKNPPTKVAKAAPTSNVFPTDKCD
jgi:hypothetical protein